MKKVALFFTVWLFGCIPQATTEYTDWDKAALSYKCTEEEHKRAVVEAGSCSDASNYSKSYCYDSAIMRICARLPK